MRSSNVQVRRLLLRALAAGALLVAASDESWSQTASFKRGDSNADARVDIGDAIHSLGFLFHGEPEALSCRDAADSNDDGGLDISDAIYTLLYLFLGTPAPPAPFPDCGADATADALDCAGGPAACAEGGGTEGTFGAAGGELVLGRFRLEVPAGLLDEPLTLGVNETALDAADLDADLGFLEPQAIGPAYELSGAFASREPLAVTLRFDAGELPPGVDPARLGVIVRQPAISEPEGLLEDSEEEPFEEDGEGPVAEDDALEVAHAPIPTVADTAAGEVRCEVFGSGTLQLAVFARPLEFETLELACDECGEGAGLGRGGGWTPPSMKIDIELGIFGFDPASYVLFAASATSALRAAYAELVVSRQYTPPPEVVVLPTTALPGGAPGAVNTAAPRIIRVDPSKTTAGKPSLEIVLAHEFYHTVQIWNLGAETARQQKNLWYLEGTADRAADLVFDNLRFAYHAPHGRRGLAELDWNLERRSRLHYETVAFWMWLEGVDGNAMQKVLLDASEKATTVRGPKVMRYRPDPVMMTASLFAAYSKLDFPAFVESLLASKDFGNDETLEGDLWHPDRMAPKGQLPAYFRSTDKHTTELRRGGPGDGKERKATANLEPPQHLAAALRIFRSASGDGGLRGDLMVEVEPNDPTEKLSVLVFSLDGQRVLLHRELPALATETLPIAPGDQVVVAAIDGTLRPSPSGIDNSGIAVHAWVEDRCGSESGQVRSASSVDAMLEALANSASGDTVLLAPGLYSPPFHDTGPPWRLHAHLRVRAGVTLAGAGAKLLLSTPSAGIGVLTEDGATLRDLAITQQGGGVVIAALGSGTLCNVSVLKSKDNSFGIQFGPVAPGSYTYRIRASLLSCADCSGSTGLLVSDCSAFPFPTLRVEIEDSDISGWEEGVAFYNGPSACGGTTTVTAACDQFSNNTYNLSECTGARCVDHCASAQ